MKKERFHLVFLTGAGISQPSGIPTFRDDGDGLWNNHPIDEVATLSAFYRDPKKVIGFMNELQLSLLDKKPNKAHYALAELEKEYDVTIITQNIDTLHEQAGSTRVIHLHGRHDEHQCLNKDCLHTWQSLDQIVLNVSQCPQCHSTNIKHHIVLFQEALNESLFDNAMVEAYVSDLFIQIGTSAVVQPACNIAKHALPRRKRVEMNLKRSVPKNPHFFQHYYIGNIIKTIDQFVLDLPKMLPSCKREKYEFAGSRQDKERYKKNNSILFKI